MKIIITLVILLFISGLAFGQNNQADTTKKKDQKNTVTPQQVHITPGASGVKRSIGYKFSSANEDGDPGNGMFRLDNRNTQEARYIIIDDKDISGNDQTKWYSTWDDPTGATARGRATLAAINGKVICVFNFTGVFTDADGYWKLPVEYVSGSSLLEGVVYYYLFERIANRNDPNRTNETRSKEQVQAVVSVPPIQVQTVVAEPQVQVQTVVAPPPVQVQTVVATPPVQVQTVVAEPPVQVQVAVAEPLAQKKDTANVISSTRVSQAAVTTTAVVTGGAIAAAQPANPPRVAQVNTQATTQPAQSKPVTQTAPPAQTKPVTQTAPPAQTKPVTQTAPPVQTKPVTQTAPPVQTKPATQAAATTVAVQPAQKTQPTQPTQTTQPVQQNQANQAVQPNNQAPAKQYNQFPVVQNIFASPGAGYGRRKWYRGIIEVGYGFGLGDYGINNFRFNFINAIRIGDFSSIGLGIGYRRYFAVNDAAPYLVSNENQIPLFLDLRTSFSTRKLTPYVALGIGTSSGYKSAGTDKGLLMFNGSGGIWYNVSSRFAVFAGIAYEMQKLQFSDTNPFADSYIKSAGSLSLNIGISF